MLRNEGKYVFNSDLAETKYVLPDVRISMVTTLKEFKDFFRVPWLIYQDDEYWVAPFWVELRDFFKRKNPFWTHAETRLFVARRNDVSIQ
ncbi:MAG: hypothetical protein ACOC80_16070 [Petrotogales bacterium]